MLRVLSCLAYDHDYFGLALALTVCALGSILTMRLFARTRRTSGARRLHWIFLAGLIGGSSIWTTHFVAMLGYLPDLPSAFEPVGTIASLFMAITFTTAGMYISATTRSSAMIEIGGGAVGLGIAAMHFVGMAAYRVSGHIEYDATMVAAAIALGCLFGATAFNRIARPVTRFCKYGGALALFLAICSMHMTAMGAATIVPDSSVVVPDQLLSGAVLAVCVISVMSLILGSGVSSYIIDTKSQEEAISRYRHLALHDPVTGLPNRTYLASLLGEATANAADDTSRLAVIAIDLDRFKDINDVHGHQAGDAVLKALAERLSAALDTGEFLARVGGDEFVAVKHKLYTVGQASDFGRKLREIVCLPIEHDDKMLAVGASIGVSVFPDHGTGADELIGRADLAMYRAKQSSVDKTCTYDASMDEASRERAVIAMELRNAVELEQLELHYQPQVDVTTGELVGFEALVRWNHPKRGMVSPGEFIPIAEETGLIVPVGNWVLRAACAEAAGWSKPLKIAINVAPAQFAQGDFPKLVHEVLLESGLSAKRLELEITESSIIGDQQHALHVVRQLKAFGIRIAMDDYGTGYSSLSTLKTFPFDKIKIDQSFIKTVDTSEQSGAIVRSTLILAESLNIPVLAEGVETADHLEFLRREGCAEAQGFFLSRPVPVSRVAEIITSGVGSASHQRNTDGLPVAPFQLAKAG
ncbi:MAG: bifunctional diguanylate cyclase/phosphodiesterase [Novosphingobium sp.]|nr:bifunctional diguanylate cyclase/phosphodiesterase [Novosphingobium sp.]